MKLDRNENATGVGKYALVNMRRLMALGHDQQNEAHQLMAQLSELGVVDWGAKGADDEFFVIKLKDRNAESALVAYADAAEEHDKEWALQVLAMSTRAKRHPAKKTPD